MPYDAPEVFDEYDEDFEEISVEEFIGEIVECDLQIVTEDPNDFDSEAPLADIVNALEQLEDASNQTNLANEDIDLPALGVEDEPTETILEGSSDTKVISARKMFASALETSLRASSEVEQNAPALSSGSNQNLDFSCNQCNFVATSKRSLTFHIKTHRTCELCGTDFSGKYSKRDLNSHTKKCGKETNHTCPICDKTFPYKYRLRDHMIKRNHFPE